MPRMTALPKPYYTDGTVTLYHGECHDLVPRLPSVHVFLFSPPYNLAGSPWPRLGHWKPGDSAGGKSKWRNGSDGGGGVRYAGDIDDGKPWDQYEAEQHRIVNACWERLTPDGAIFYQHKPRVIGARLWRPDSLIPDDLPIRQEIIWARAGGVNFTEVAFCPTHEVIIVVAKETWRLKSKAASGIGDVWRIPQEPSPHPAPFPVGLPARVIDASGPRLICDPYCGSGTTLVAAKAAGIPAIGIEQSEAYCEMAVERLTQTSLFETGNADYHQQVSMFEAAV